MIEPSRFRIRAALLAVLVLAALGAEACHTSTSSSGQNATGASNSAGGRTLAQVQARGVLRVGVNDSLPGFGFLQPDGTFAGFDVDFAHAIAAAIFGDASKVQLIPVSATDRFQALTSGQIDVLIRNTTWSLQRGTQLHLTFSVPNYYDGQGVMVRKSDHIKSLADLNGAVVCSLAATTTQLNSEDQFTGTGVTYHALAFDRAETLQEAFIAGRCDAWTSDKSQLAARRAGFPMQAGGPDSLEILPDTLSREPFSAVTRDNDAQWSDIVNWVIVGMMDADDQGVTSQNVQQQSVTPSSPEIARLLSVPVDGQVFDPGLGLKPGFMKAVILQVGNYDEVYQRNLGKLGLPRDGSPNASYRKGGPSPAAVAMTAVEPARPASGIRDVFGHGLGDPVLRRWAIEAGSVAVVLFVGGYLLVRAFQLDVSFDFLRNSAGFGIGDQFLTHVTGKDPSWKVYIAGASNTLQVSAFGIVIATGLGVITGVGRLSSNWLVAKIALWYVELVRNTPSLVFVVFWYTAVVLRLPPIWQSIHFLDIAYLSNRALAFPGVLGGGRTELWWVIALLGTVAGIVCWRRLARRAEVEGRALPAARIGLAIAVGVAIVAFVALGEPLHIQTPTMLRYSYNGGLQFSPEFAGLLLGVAVYRGAFVGEVVRGALQAVPRGEREAAASLGLTGTQQMTHVVLPQALRMIVPSMVGQCQVLVKATSVAVAIAYPDMLSIGRTIVSNSGQAEAMFIVILASYLAINLLLALVLTLMRKRWLAARP